MKISIAMLAVVSTLILVSQASPLDVKEYRRVCYFGSWAVYRYGKAKFSIDNIDTSLCTHFIYTFVGLSPYNNQVTLLDAWNDVGDEWKKGLIPQIQEKCKKTNTKFMPAIGGWNEGSEKYSQVCKDPVRRAALVKSIVQFVKDINADGFDVDWEYPAQRGGDPTDRVTFTLLLKELHEALHPQGKIISIAVTANALTIDQSYNVPEVVKYVDMINVMAYDLHGSWDSKTGHNAPLYAGSTDDHESQHLNIKSAVEAWIGLGAPPSVLNLGMGTYGRSFNLNDPSNHGVGAPAGGIPPCGWIQENGFYGYNEICYRNNSYWTTEWDDEQKVPYAYNGRNWVGYDDVLSIRLKTCFAKEMNLGGAMIWSIETDDFLGDCGQGKYPLINSMVAGLADPSCGSSRPSAPTPLTTTTTTQAPTAATPEATQAPTAATPEATQAPTAATPEATQAPTAATPEATQAPTATTPEATQATDAPAPAPQPTNPEPSQPPAAPTTSAPAPQEEDIFEASKPVSCSYMGERLKDPSDCSSFLYCAPGVGNTIVPMKMSCGGGLAYDSNNNICNHKRSVQC